MNKWLAPLLDIWKKQKIANRSTLPVTKRMYEDIDNATRMKFRDGHLERRFNGYFSRVREMRGQMGLIYHAATLPLYKNAADAKLENTSLSAGVFIRAT